MTRIFALSLQGRPLPAIHALPLALVLLMIPALALAHPGHGQGFADGVGHPLGGADHMLAMVAVGLWAALTGGRALWALPLGFVGAMGVGAVLGMAGIALPLLEPMIAASVVVLGAAAALALRPALGQAVLAVALFGLMHGNAHGLEGAGAGYATGFVLATAGLHLAGLALGLGLMRIGQRQGARLVAGGTALAGLALAFA